MDTLSGETTIFIFASLLCNKVNSGGQLSGEILFFDSRTLFQESEWIAT